MERVDDVIDESGLRQQLKDSTMLRTFVKEEAALVTPSDLRDSVEDQMKTVLANDLVAFGDILHDQFDRTHDADMINQQRNSYAKTLSCQSYNLGGTMFWSGDADAKSGSPRSLITQVYNTFGRANMAFEDNNLNYPTSQYANIRAGAAVTSAVPVTSSPDAPVTTVAPVTSAVPVTSSPDSPVTTVAPVTSEVPVTSSPDAPVTSSAAPWTSSAPPGT
ncbi:hypothetical protein DYB28_001066, partial [Aphanomyces astaci]